MNVWRERGREGLRDGHAYRWRDMRDEVKK